MKFIVTYGCDGLGNEKLAVEAENEEVALEYAYNAAFEYRESYGGLHGTQDFSDFCEEEGYDPEDEDAWDSFHDMVEHEVEYFVEVFNETDEEHQWVLTDCNGKFWEI